MALAYPARFATGESGFIVVTFRDIPEAMTQARDMPGAIDMARDVLDSAISFYLEDYRQVPEPSGAKAGEHLIELQADLAAAVQQMNEAIALRLTAEEFGLIRR